MPRIRSIKPDYWKSEKLASRLPGPDGREARRLFIGLWNFAEDHGVVRASAVYIRAELYPYDDDVTAADVERWLCLLEAGGFIVRYQRDGSTYAWIRGFLTHQRIKNPSNPSLPEPSEAEKNRPTPETVEALPQGYPSPTPGLPVGGGGGREVEEEEEGSGEPSAADAAPMPASAFGGIPKPQLLLVEEDRRAKPQPPDVPRTEAPEALMRAWNEKAHPSLPRVREMTKGRKKAATSRLRERPLAEWLAIIEQINASAFCRGERPRPGHEQWRANFDWLLKPETATRVLEGTYDDGPRHGQRAPNPTRDTGGDPVCVTL